MNKRVRKNRSAVNERPKRIFNYFNEDDTPYVEWGLNDELTGAGAIRRRLPLQTYHGMLQFQN